MILKLNFEQSRHLAATLRAYGLGQVAAFGYTGIQTGYWLIVAVSTVVALAAEIGAMLSLKDIGDST